MVGLKCSCRGRSHFDKPRVVTKLQVDYAIIDTISNTLYGSIYKVRHQSTGQEYATKSVPKNYQQLRSNLGAWDNVEEEFRIHCMLSSLTDKVVEVIDFLEDEQNYYLVMELGVCDLHTFVSSKEIDEEEARRLFKQIVECIDEVHACGIAHLDLSLENFLLCKDGKVKLCDFGVAREVDMKTMKFVDPISKDFQPGKMQYKDPEIVMCDRWNNHHDEWNGFEADSFSIGVMLFCMLFGFYPFEKATVQDLHYAMLINNHPEILFYSHECVGLISDDAEDLICQMLSLSKSRIPFNEIQSHCWISGCKGLDMYINL